MVAGAFPIIKLGVLAFKQISKPIAGSLRERAKRSHFFRTYICMPPAQLYHWMEVNVKMRILNLGKPSEVPKLNEAMAIELGAQMLGELVVFTIAAGTLTFEYIRSSNKEKDKEDSKEQQLNSMIDEIQDLRFVTEKQDTEIRSLTRHIFALEHKLEDINVKQDSMKKNSSVSKSAVETAVEHATGSLKSRS